jgi:hypothetical protein
MSKALEAALASIAVPWRRRRGSAMVEAYSPALNGWAVVAEGRDTAELTAKDVAALIVKAVNGNRHDEELITELVGALTTCLDCPNGRLDFSAEQEAEAALHKAGERRKADKP